MKKILKIFFGGGGIITILISCIVYWEKILPVLTSIGLFFRYIFMYLIQPHFFSAYCVIIFIFLYSLIKNIFNKTQNNKTEKKLTEVMYEYEKVNYIFNLNRRHLEKRCSECDVLIDDNRCVRCNKDFSFLENGKYRLNDDNVFKIIEAEYRKYSSGKDHELKLFYNYFKIN